MAGTVARAFIASAFASWLLGAFLWPSGLFLHPLCEAAGCSYWLAGSLLLTADTALRRRDEPREDEPPGTAVSLLYGEGSPAELPRRCSVGMPALLPAWDHPSYRWLVAGLQARGCAIEGAPGACGAPGCHHPKVWHRQRTRLRPCERPGCGCEGFR